MGINALVYTGPSSGYDKAQGLGFAIPINSAIKIAARPKKSDSADLYLGDEQIGTVSVDDEDGDRSFVLTMPILDVDLED